MDDPRPRDIVELKSGSPLLCVLSRLGDNVVVTWEIGGEKKCTILPAACLTVIRKAKRLLRLVSDD